MYPSRQTFELMLARVSFIILRLSYPKGSTEAELSSLLIYEVTGNDGLERIISSYKEREMLVVQCLLALLRRMSELEHGGQSFESSIPAKIFRALE